MSTSLDSRRKVSIAIRYLQSKIVKIHTVETNGTLSDERLTCERPRSRN